MSDVENCAVCEDAMSQTLIQNERFTDLMKLVKVQYPDMSVRLSPREGERHLCMQRKASGLEANIKENRPKVLAAPYDWEDEWHPIGYIGWAQ